MIKDTYNLIVELKKQGYKIYLLSNITKTSFEYIKDTTDLMQYIDGGLYSYQEKMVKPHYAFFERLIKKYNLSKDETIFFDDKDKNIKAGKEIGIKSIKFTSIDDVKDNLVKLNL